MLALNNGEKLYGYAGKILRIDLTEKTTSEMPTAAYVPKYMGGRALATKIYWDLVKKPVDAFDPDAKLVFATGAGAGTALPYSGRSFLVGIGAMGIPQQFMFSGLGGQFGAALKYAGYDGFVLEGVAEKPTYIYIEDSKVSFLDAGELWGGYVADTQNNIRATLGKDVVSMVIGPAGENKVRFASVVTGNDSVAAKAGFGAVFGAKNLKAIAVRGTGTVEVAHPESVLKIRRDPSVTPFHKNPTVPAAVLSTVRSNDERSTSSEADTDGAMNAYQTVCTGCLDHCSYSVLNVPDDILHKGQKFSMLNKCLDPMAYSYASDCAIAGGCYHHEPAQEKPGAWRWFGPSAKDPDGPYYDFLTRSYPGDKYDLWQTDTAFGRMMLWLCNQYGMDKWEVNIGLYTWLAMCYKEGLLKDLDLGFEGDPCTAENCYTFLTNVCYRKGLGDVFAEGIAHATRILGKKKYGESIYHGRFNAITGERLDIPVSLEACWGMVSHWLGRGFQGCPKTDWLMIGIGWMLSSRDAACGEHPANLVSDYIQYYKDPYHSDVFVNAILTNLNRHDLKDMAATCDFRSPNPTWPDLEAQLFEASTGNKATMEELFDQAIMSRLQTRAVYMRDHKRCRDMEVEMIYPWLTWPDPWGETASWDDFNDLVDKVYEAQGWDLATGWPFRSTWEKYGLKDVADEMEKLGMLPPEGGTPGYVRKPCPFPEHDCPVGVPAGEAEADPEAIQEYATASDERMRSLLVP